MIVSTILRILAIYLIYRLVKRYFGAYFPSSLGGQQHGSSTSTSTASSTTGSGGKVFDAEFTVLNDDKKS